MSKKGVEGLTSLCYSAQSNQVEDKYPKNREGIKLNFACGLTPLCGEIKAAIG